MMDTLMRMAFMVIMSGFLFLSSDDVGVSARKVLTATEDEQLQDLTKEFQCEKFHGQVVCNGTNEFYANFTSQFEAEAKKLQSKMSDTNGTISRSGDYFPCSEGLDHSCTLLETILIPTFLTNADSQPRYIYQNRQAGIVQEIRLVSCRKGPCGRQGYGKCYPNERRYLLLSVNPYKPNKVFPDIFAVPGCCICGQPSPPPRPPSGPDYGSIGPGVINKPGPYPGKPQPYYPYNGNNGYEGSYGHPLGYGGNYGGGGGGSGGYGMGGYGMGGYGSGNYGSGGMGYGVQVGMGYGNQGNGYEYSDRSRPFQPGRGSRVFSDDRSNVSSPTPRI